MPDRPHQWNRGCGLIHYDARRPARGGGGRAVSYRRRACDRLSACFRRHFGFSRIFGIPVTVATAITAIAVAASFLYGTRFGRHLYAVGGNVKAAKLSGINTTATLLIAYGASALLASIDGLLLTARVESGEANLGGTIALQSIAACEIGGVSLHGGIGRVENVVLGVFFIVLIQNGMDLMQIGSYMQMVLLGVLLILAVIVDQVRYRLLIGAN
jgi:ribose transport system permease protein